MRAYYLCSPTFISVALIMLSLSPFDAGIATVWFPCTALPYFVLYARDLRLLGYSWADLPRVYTLNLMLLPINLAGVIRSIQQMLSSRYASFAEHLRLSNERPYRPSMCFGSSLSPLCLSSVGSLLSYEAIIISAYVGP